MRSVALAYVILLSATTALADVVVPIDAVSSRVIVRAQPTSDSTDLGSLHPGDEAELVGSVPSW